MTSRLLGTLVVAVCCTIGCQKPQPPLRFESEFFRFYGLPGRYDCLSSLEWFDFHWKAHAAYLGLPPIPPRKFEYYDYSSIAELQELGCASVARSDSDGCFESPNIIRTVREYHPHELIHAYLEPLGRPPRLFMEGIAEYLDCRTGFPGGPPVLLSEWSPALLTEDGFLKLMQEKGLSGPYHLAMSFVGHLIRAKDIKTFVRFYSVVRSSDRLDDVLKVLEREYGPYETLIAAWKGDAINRPAANDVKCIAECGSPPVEPLSNAVSFGPGCGLPEADGFIQGAIRTFSVEKEETVRLRVTSDATAPAWVNLNSCDGREVARPSSASPYLETFPDAGTAAAELWATLSPGQYYAQVRYQGPKVLPERASLGLERLPEPALTCPSAAQIPYIPYPVSTLYYLAQAGTSGARQGALEFRRSNAPGLVMQYDQFVMGREFLSVSLADGGFDNCLADFSRCGFSDAEVFFEQTPKPFELCSCTTERQCVTVSSDTPTPLSGISEFELIRLPGETISMSWSRDAGSEVSFGFNFYQAPR
jgi:hypothetical protein